MLFTHGPLPTAKGLHIGRRPVVTDVPVMSVNGWLSWKHTQNDGGFDEPGAPGFNTTPLEAGKVTVEVIVPVAPSPNVLLSLRTLGECSKPS